MNAHVQFRSNAAGLSASVEREAIEDSVTKACGRIAPLWPLKHFVAVNPFLGFAGQPFAATAAALKRVAKVDMLMPRHFYRAALTSGVIDDAALGEALARAARDSNRPSDVAALKQAAAMEVSCELRPPAAVSTVAEILDSLADGDRQTSLVGFMIEEISKWCAAYFDEGQAIWRMPQRTLSPYAAWRRTARYDLSAEAMGVARFRETVLSLPEDPIETIRTVVGRLGVPASAVEDYLQRTLLDIGGWAAYARYLVWNSELNGEKNDTLVELLAIRVAYGYGLFRGANRHGVQERLVRGDDDGSLDPARSSPERRPGSLRSISSSMRPMRSLSRRSCMGVCRPTSQRRSKLSPPSGRRCRRPSASMCARKSFGARWRRFGRRRRQSASPASSASRSNMCRSAICAAAPNVPCCSSPPSPSAKRSSTFPPRKKREFSTFGCCVAAPPRRGRPSSSRRSPLSPMSKRRA